MNSNAYIKGFAWLSLIALSLSIFSTYWLPMLLGAVVAIALFKLAS